MQLKDNLFTLINSSISAVICLYDETRENSTELIEVIDYLVDGALEDRIVKSKNSSLIKQDASHFFFTKNFGKTLNIIFTKLPNTPSNNEVSQFIKVIDAQDAQKEEFNEGNGVVVIKPKGNSFKFNHPVLQIHHVEY